MEEQIKYLRAAVYLLAQQINEDKLGVKKEVLLVAAGLSYKEVAAILGKTEAGVQKASSRARLGERRGAVK